MEGAYELSEAGVLSARANCKTIFCNDLNWAKDLPRCVSQTLFFCDIRPMFIYLWGTWLLLSVPLIYTGGDALCSPDRIYIFSVPRRLRRIVAHPVRRVTKRCCLKSAESKIFWVCMSYSDAFRSYMRTNRRSKLGYFGHFQVFLSIFSFFFIRWRRLKEDKIWLFSVEFCFCTSRTYTR